MEWNDNIRLAPNNTQGDFIFRPQANVLGSWAATKDSTLSFGIRLGYQKYINNPDLDQLTVTPDSELAWDIPVKDFVFTVYDRFQDSQDVISQGGLSGTAQFPRIENTAGLRARWHPAEYVFELGYSHYNFFPQSSSFDYLSRAEEQFFGRAACRIAMISQAGMEASGSLVNYDDPTRTDNRSLSIGPFIDWQVIRDLRLSLRGGYVIYLSGADPKTGIKNNVGSFYIGFDANQRLTRYITHDLSATREIQQGVNLGSQFTEDLTVRYSVQYAFLRRAGFSSDFFYEHAIEPQFGVVEVYDRFGVGGGLTFQLPDHFSVGVACHFTTKNSNFASRDYRQNVVTLNANYQF